MTLLAPLGLLGLLALPVLIALRLIGARRRARTVGALLLWERAAAGLPAGGGWRRPPWADLALECGALAAVAVALADPAWVGTAAGSRVLVVLDRTASMGAVDAAGTTAWERGLAALADRLAEWPSTTTFTLRAVPPFAAGVVQGDRETVLAAARSARPAPTGGDPRAAAHAGEHAHTLLVTDRLPALAADDPLEVLAVGTPAPNGALTRLTVDADGRAFVVCTATGAPRVATITLQADDATVTLPPVTLAPGHEIGRAGRIAPGAARVTATLADGGALAADDRLVVERGQGAARVAWIGPDAPLLRRALAAALDAELVVHAPEPGGEPPLATVIHQAVPAALPEGPVLIVDPRAPIPDVPWTPATAAVTAAPAGPNAPAWRAVHLATAAPPPTGWCPVPPRGAVPHWRAPGGPVVWHWPRPAGPCAVVGLPVTGHGWELTPSYPVFWARLWAAVVPHAADRFPTATFEAAESDLTGAGTGHRAGRPAGTARTRVVRHGGAWWVVAALVGLWLRLARRP